MLRVSLSWVKVGFGRVGVGRHVRAAVAAGQEHAGRTGHVGQRMLVDVHRGPAGVAAGQVGEGGAAVGRAEDIHRAAGKSRRSCWGRRRCSGRTSSERSRRSSRSGRFGWSAAARWCRRPWCARRRAGRRAGRRRWRDGLRPDVDHVGVAGGDRGVEAAEPVAGQRGGVDRNAGGGVGRPAVVGPAERFPTQPGSRWPAGARGRRRWRRSGPGCSVPSWQSRVRR